MRNLRLDLCYDGTRYKGWQRLPGTDMTIQGKLETTLSRILGEAVEVTGSGRTDAGVHAVHQIANFHCKSAMAAEEILSQLRRYLPEDIGIYSCKEVSERFHARLNAKQKTYRYRLWVSEQPCVFERRQVARYPQRPDVEKMRRAASLLVGSHDFSAFCANRHMKKSTVRNIREINISSGVNEVTFEFTGDGFLYNMVRILVGTLIEVGIGERPMDSIPELFGATREYAGFLAPANGLCLVEVEY